MENIGKTWAELKALVSPLVKNLALQYDESTWDDSYRVFAIEDGTVYYCRILKSDPANEDQTDFETNFRSACNGRVRPTSLDKIPQVNAIPAVDPGMACFCPCAFGRPTPENPGIDITVSGAYWQMSGLTLDVEGAAAGDYIEMMVGYMAGDFVVVSLYGTRYYVRSSDHLDHNSVLRSNPIPQGMIMRLLYNFADAQNPSTPIVAGMYHMWRPYA